jgi:hypothetical protein
MPLSCIVLALLYIVTNCNDVVRYTARWFFSLWRVMDESTTTSELSSYYMDSYDGGLTSSGDGKLNWRGNVRCGQQSTGHTGGAGIQCQGVRSGSPETNPNGGSGCNVNIGRQPYHFNWFMCRDNYDTYVSICNGEQHSSSDRFSSRVWIRSPDSQKDW